MIEIKNKMGAEVSISYDGTSEIIAHNTLIDIETLGSANSKQGLARLIALILTDSFEIHKDSVNQGTLGHILLNKRFNTIFNNISNY